MNLFQFGWLGCLAQPYFHIYFNKQCRVGRENTRWVYTQALRICCQRGSPGGGVRGMLATVPSILEKNTAAGLARGAVCRRRASW